MFPAPSLSSAGATSLVAVSNHFFLDSISTGSDPSLKYGGADVVAGQFGGWTPIGAEQTASGYQVAWKVSGADQYSVWTTDSNGNFISTSAILSGNSSVLKSFETSFHQDLNGDGAIGVPGMSRPARPWTAPTSAVERPCLILDLRGMSKRLLDNGDGKSDTLWQPDNGDADVLDHGRHQPQPANRPAQSWTHLAYRRGG